MYQAVIPSPPDPRDYPLSRALDIAGGAYPDTYECWQPPIENQGSVGNCVAQAIANIMECIHHQKTQMHRNYSVGYIYGRDGTNYGMSPQGALNGLIKGGDVFRDIWECLEENPACKIAYEAIPDSIHKLADKPLMYVTLKSADEIKAFMLRYHLPVFCVTYAIDYGINEDWQHAVVCSGWRSDGKMHITNSWGATAGPDRDGTWWLEPYMLRYVWGIVPMEVIKFTDVKDDRWSAQAIQEAVDDGIFKGFEDGSFKPEAPLTREQMAVLWQRIKAKVNP